MQSWGGKPSDLSRLNQKFPPPCFFSHSRSIDYDPYYSLSLPPLYFSIRIHIYVLSESSSGMLLHPWVLVLFQRRLSDIERGNNLNHVSFRQNGRICGEHTDGRPIVYIFISQIQDAGFLFLTLVVTEMWEGRERKSRIDVVALAICEAQHPRFQLASYDRFIYPLSLSYTHTYSSCVSLSLSPLSLPFLSLSFSLFLSRTHSLYPSPPPFSSISLTLSISISLSLSLPFLWLSPSLSLTFSISLPHFLPPPCLTFSSLSLPLSLTFSRSQALSLAFFLTFPLSLRPLTFFFSLSCSHSPSVYLSVSFWLSLIPFRNILICRHVDLRERKTCACIYIHACTTTSFHLDIYRTLCTSVYLYKPRFSTQMEIAGKFSGITSNRIVQSDPEFKKSKIDGGQNTRLSAKIAQERRT